jgi:hypothetical protein
LWITSCTNSAISVVSCVFGKPKRSYKPENLEAGDGNDDDGYGF